MRGDPRNIHAYARTRTVESIMALVGRSLPEPRRVRNFLEQEMSDESLSKLLTALLDNHDLEMEVIMQQPGESPGITGATMPAGLRLSSPDRVAPDTFLARSTYQPSALAGDDNAAADDSKFTGAASPFAPVTFTPGLTDRSGEGRNPSRDAATDIGHAPAPALSLSAL